MTAQIGSTFGVLPAEADKAAVQPFQVHVPEEELEHMKALLKLSRVASPSYENSLPDGSRNLGLRREWILQAKETWENNFDWRQHERRINSLPNFRAQIPFAGSTIGIHFVALFSQNPNATPLILFHGWPGSFLEFLPILGLLQKRYPDPKQLPYHVIVPSLPGYGFSDPPPVDREFDLVQAAGIFDHLLVRILGLTGYLTQGGDIGSRVARLLAAKYEHCRGAHLNFCHVSQPEGTSVGDLPEVEQEGLRRFEKFMANGRGYSLMHATRPGTLGLVLSSSPLAVLGWVAEKFLDWSDPRSFPEDAKLPGTQIPYSKELMDEILVSASLYWLSGKLHTCVFSYRHEADPERGADHNFPGYRIHAPKQFGYSYFPLELTPTPVSWVKTTGNLVFSRTHQQGGHFAALEQPEALLADIDEFVGTVVSS
ncbi:epoxide hydrolase 1 [Thozetella sp. PMI_491]|nr:epoxide hydrolase 1 [Thozetella sp. PMI_491]